MYQSFCNTMQLMEAAKKLIYIIHLKAFLFKLDNVSLLIYIYIYIYIYMEHPFLMFLDHTQRRSTVGRTPLDE